MFFTNRLIKSKCFLAATLLVLCSIAPAADVKPAIIPQPVEMTARGGEFRVGPDTAVVAGRNAAVEAAKLIENLAPAMGFRLKLVESPPDDAGAVVLTIDPSLKSQFGDEGYSLRVTPQQIDLRAAGSTGLFYGGQTLRQLLPPRIFSNKLVEGVNWTIPCVAIRDYPRFGWRGLLIDPARHFIPVEDVKRFIDIMALHKFNRLQMHLTDNIGWRVEIKKYPDLTRLASNRDRSGGKGGFYSQADIRDFVHYAEDRHITIVPEIEMPYHAGAAINAYPQLGINPGRVADLSLDERWGKLGGLVAPRTETVSFMQDVLSEVIELFPSRFIHIGGDEANLRLWQNDPELLAQMKRLGCKDAHELHSWFIKQMDAFLARRGRRLLGWDEILQGGLAPGATVMSWRGIQGGITAARAGHDVVMAPTSHTYFDYRQAPEETGLGRSVIDLEKVYAFEVIPADLAAEQARHVLGGQAQLWGELIPDQKRREFMAYPRACALIETLWSPKRPRDFERFLERLDQHLARLDALEVNYRQLDRPIFPAPEEPQSGGPRAARALAERLLPDHADRFEFESIPPLRGRDVFEIETRDGKTVIRGNNGLAMAVGLNWFLKHYCRCHVSWCGNQLDLPDPLPAVEQKVLRRSWARYRYFLNYCCFGYSLPWHDWEQWERLIDWMALNGVNAPLAVTGQEAVWRAVCRRLGMSDEQIGDFLAGPPYLPFQWMGCLDGWGGPLPQSWIDRHEQLQQRILARQRELGMTPVLQGFTGHVPAAIRRKSPDAKLHQIRWAEWQTQILDPLDPLFPKIAGMFLEEQTKRFGTDHLYAADTLIEMTPPSGDLNYLGNLGRAIYNGMAKTDAEAVWVLQGWAFMNQRSFWTQPRLAAFLDAVPDDRMVVLDLFCESTPMWSRTDAFCGKPWLWCNVQSFGCAVHLGGALSRNNDDLMAARGHPHRGKLAGLGFVNEGLDYNPIVYDLMYEMAWRNEPVDLNEWVCNYSRHRYGRSNADAQAAWTILADTVYTAPHRTRSIVDHAPTLGPCRGFPPYENASLAQAWRHLLNAADELGRPDTCRFDLVNVARQVLVNHAETLREKVVQAYRAKDTKAFQESSQRFLGLLADVDDLLATREEFLLGRWLEDAKRWGDTDVARSKFEWNARRVLTLWGEGPAIDDYARKEWAGMIRGYYTRRWQRYFDALAESLESDQPFDEKAFNQELRQWMNDWSGQQETYNAEPRGDSVAVAAALWGKYGHAFKPDSLSLTTGKPATCSSVLPLHPARLANDGFANTARYWATDVKLHPGQTWWQVDLEKPTDVGRVVVIAYYGDRRYYGFTVETSLDGRTWDLVADHRDNRDPSTKAGYVCRFESRPVRYIRVNQPHNSANTGRHLVEVTAFGE